MSLRDRWKALPRAAKFGTIGVAGIAAYFLIGEPALDAWNRFSTRADQDQAVLEKFALAEADFAGVEPWRGLRPCSPDGLPYLGRTSRYDNLVVATGHAMMGLSLAPITGRIVGQLVAGEPPEHDLALLSPDRFG